jgi:hypothetical protein
MGASLQLKGTGIADPGYRVYCNLLQKITTTDETRKSG